MADVAVDATLQSNFAAQFAGHSQIGTYWKDDSVGYVFYLDANAGGPQLSYSKTSNGGSSWGAAVSIAAGSQFINTFGAWADWETPGDAGTKIHLAYTRGDNETTNYRSLDVATDTLGTAVEITTTVGGAGSTPSDYSGSFLSITKARGGNLYVAVVNGNGENGFFRSTNAGAAWGSRSSPIEDTSDRFLLLPAGDTDANDIACLYQDDSANQASFKLHDDSANTWGNETNIVTLTLGSSSFFPFDGAIRASDNKAIVNVWNAVNGATADLTTWELTLTAAGAAASAKGDVLTNSTGSAGAATMIDNNTGDLYCAYYRGTLYTSTTVYYKKSTDGGATWGTEAAYGETARAHHSVYSQSAVKSGGAGRFEPAFIDETNDDLYVNFGNSVAITGASPVNASVTGIVATATAAGVAGTIAAVRTQAVTGAVATTTAAGIAGTIVAVRPASVTGAVAAATSAGVAGTVEAQNDVAVTGAVASATAAGIAGTIAAQIAATVTGVPAEATAVGIAGTVATVRIVTVTGEVAEATAEGVAGTTAAQVAATVTGAVAEGSAAGVEGSIATVQTRAVTGEVAEATAQGIAGTANTGFGVTVTGAVAQASAAGVEGAIATVRIVAVTGEVAEATAAGVAGAVSTGSIVNAAVAGAVAQSTADGVAGTLAAVRNAAVTGAVAQATAEGVAGTAATVRNTSVTGAVASSNAAALAGAVLALRMVALAGSPAEASAAALAGVLTAISIVSVTGETATATAAALPGTLEGNPGTVGISDRAVSSVAMSDRGTTVLMTDRQIGRVTISDRRSI